MYAVPPHPPPPPPPTLLAPSAAPAKGIQFFNFQGNQNGLIDLKEIKIINNMHYGEERGCVL